MRETRTGNRYAKAILQLAEEEKKIDQLTSDFNLLDGLINKSRDLRLLLDSPIINRQKKKKALSALFEKKVADLTLKFLLLLTDKNRETLLPSIISQYNRLLDKKNNVVDAVVITVVPFTGSQSREIKKKLEGITKKTVRLSFKIDTKLMGGFKVRIEDTIFDGSVLQQFKLIKDRFTAGGVFG
jgi:F-type H+-transporting ATPase subunit delta